jgi:hypothetical protein
MMAGGTFLEKKFPPHPLQKTYGKRNKLNLLGRQKDYNQNLSIGQL